MARVLFFKKHFWFSLPQPVFHKIFNALWWSLSENILFSRRTKNLFAFFSKSRFYDVFSRLLNQSTAKSSIFFSSKERRKLLVLWSSFFKISVHFLRQNKISFKKDPLFPRFLAVFTFLVYRTLKNIKKVPEPPKTVQQKCKSIQMRSKYQKQNRKFDGILWGFCALPNSRIFFRKSFFRIRRANTFS